MTLEANSNRVIMPTVPDRSAPFPEAPGEDHRVALAKAIATTDAVVLALSSLVAVVVRFGVDPTVGAGGDFNVTYSALGLGIAAAWWFTLGTAGSRSPKVIGVGTDEYRIISRVTFLLFGIVAIASLLFRVDISRGFLAIAFPLGLAGLALTRRMWRRWVGKQRAQEKLLMNVLVIGGRRSAADITRWLRRHKSSGYRTTGVWVPDAPDGGKSFLNVADTFVPVMGNSRTLTEALRISDASTAIVTDTEHLGRVGLKNLTWQLEAAGVELLVAPNVFDVSGSRIHVAEFASMPVLNIEGPRYAEAARWPKAAFDKAGAAGILLFASPIMLVAALAVKFTSKGPVFYKQERIGLDGEPFEMIKFRSMYEGAERQLQALLEAEGVADPVGKVKQDPRVTKVGRVIRRYSIDELPQLFNVLRGDMSLVGPRPPLRFEVEKYAELDHRRLRVRPGMTGLWQVSGRSDLTWEESIRLDTYYVENWSMIGDVQILWRTFAAVVGKSGAY